MLLLTKSFQISNVRFYLKTSNKSSSNRLKRINIKETIRIREKKILKQKTRIFFKFNEIKSWFIEKINIIDKFVTRLNGKIRQKLPLSGMEEGYYYQTYINKKTL